MATKMTREEAINKVRQMNLPKETMEILQALAPEEALSSDWLYLGGKHYCPDCYELDDEDHYHTKDGKVWDADTDEEIKI